MKQLAIFLSLFVATVTAYAQTGVTFNDTVLLMSGKRLLASVQDTAGDRLRIFVPDKDNKPKAEVVDLDLVFSVVYGKDSREVLFYKQDTLFGNYFTPNEVRVFMMGENDARKHYRSTLWTAGSIVACGAAGAFLSPFAALAGPFAMAGISAFPRVKIQPSTVSNPEYLKYDTYILGYEKEARKRRMFRVLIGGAAGFAAGLTSAIIIANSK